MQTEVVLSLGGNKGDREKLLFRAIEMLNDHFQLLKVSRIYETTAWGGVAKGDFLNQLALISTNLEPEEVLEIIQEIEQSLGRIREEPWGDRTMDIDILYFGEKVISSERLKIPHPFIAERKFVLVPLAEMLPDKIHPMNGKNSLVMVKECKDQSEVKVIKDYE
jgi:2-amino-4-hydroxy-6-hydroxymethyldihydropteridine diphosphokinase